MLGAKYMFNKNLIIGLVSSISLFSLFSQAYAMEGDAAEAKQEEFDNKTHVSTKINDGKQQDLTENSQQTKTLSIGGFNLPKEMVQHIISFLDFKDFLNFSQTSMAVYTISNEDIVWVNYLPKDIQKAALAESLKEGKKNTRWIKCSFFMNINPVVLIIKDCLNCTNTKIQVSFNYWEHLRYGDRYKRKILPKIQSKHQQIHFLTKADLFANNNDVDNTTKESDEVLLATKINPIEFSVPGDTYPYCGDTDEKINLYSMVTLIEKEEKQFYVYNARQKWDEDLQQYVLIPSRNRKPTAEEQAKLIEENPYYKDVMDSVRVRMEKNYPIEIKTDFIKKPKTKKTDSSK
jgi:hypothetical protein